METTATGILETKSSKGVQFNVNLISFANIITIYNILTIDSKIK